MGGGFVLLLAAQQGDKVAAAVPFYGVGPAVPDSYRGITAAVQGHYAENDGFYPVADARAQEQQIRDESGAEVQFFYYPAGHAFHNDKDLMGTYDERERQAGLAPQRRVPAHEGVLMPRTDRSRASRAGRPPGRHCASSTCCRRAERPQTNGRGIHHAALICSDVATTIEFYQGLLGFPLIELVENRDYPGLLALLLRPRQLDPARILRLPRPRSGTRGRGDRHRAAHRDLG